MGYLAALAGTGRMGQGMAFRSIFLTTFACALASAGATSAQVLSIGDDGAVTTYSGPAVYTSDGATAIIPPDAPAPMRIAP